MLIAHRGTPRVRPENSLPGFLRALELGAGGIELDVHATKDGVVVVHHDPVPRADAPSARLAGRRIDTLTFDQLQGFSLQGAALIPTLAETLQVVKGRAELFIELKGEGIERAVAEEIRRSPHAARCAVHAFDHDAIARLRAIAPELRRGILLDRLPLDLAASLAETGALDVWPRWELADPVLVAAIHQAGARAIAWTVNSGDAARRLAALAVDGLCSDDLGVVRAALAERA